MPATAPAPRSIAPAIERLPDADELLGEAMFTRIQSNMQLGETDAAVEGFQAMLQDAEVGAAQGGRIGALLTALGRPPEEQATPQPEAEVPGPIGE